MNKQVQAQIKERIDACVLEVYEILKTAVAGSMANAFDEVVLPGGSNGRAHAAAAGGGKAKKTGKLAADPPAKVEKASGRRGRRSPEKLEALAERLFQEIRRDGGRRMEQIAISLRSTPKDLAAPMAKLMAAKRLTTVGVARGTKYTAAKKASKKSATKGKKRK